MGLRVQLLGGFAVWRDGVLLEKWDSEQTKNLLKILVSERGRTFRLEELCEYLWPKGENVSQTLRFLRACVHKLRRTLEPNATKKSLYIQTSHDGYYFSKDVACSVDIEEFATHITCAKRLTDQNQFTQAAPEYEQAIDLYKGNYLAEDRYEEWASAARDRWRSQYVLALLELAECRARLGHYRRAIELCLKAREIDKYREDIYRQAMLYHFLMGNQGEALRIYQDCEKILVEELSVKPSPPTQQLRSQILAGQISGIDGFDSSPPPIEHPVHHSLGRLPFVGRTGEYSQLVEGIKKALQGHGSIVFVGGEAGAGKTRLAQEAIHYAQREFKLCLLQGRCTELGAKQPYQALLQALHSYLSLKTPQELEQMPSLSRSVLAPWFPDLEHLLSSGSLPTVTPDQERLRFFTGVSQLLLKIARTDLPTVLFLDDLHWADASTTDFIDYLVGSITQNPLLIIGTYRLEEVPKDHPLASLLRRAARESIETPIYDLRLPRLSRDAIEALLKERAPSLENPGHLSEYLHKESAGNALFLVSVLQSLFEIDAMSVAPEGTWVVAMEKISQQGYSLRPREIQEILRARIERLAREDRQLLEMMSVAGQRSETSILTGAWQTLSPHQESQLQFLERCERLEEAQFIVNTEAYSAFVHDRIRETVYETLSLSRRQWLHRCVAEAIETTYRDSAQKVDSLLAHHYAQANMPAKALPYLLRVLKEAVAGYRNAEGLQMAQEAWDMTEKLAASGEKSQTIDQMQSEILEAQVTIYHILGRRIEQEDALNRMLELSLKLGDYKSLAETHLLRSELFVNTGRHALSQAEGLKCLKVATDNNDSAYKHRALQQIGVTHWRAGNYHEAIEYLTQAYELQKSLGDGKNCAETLRYLGNVFLRNQQREKAVESYQQALELLQTMDDRQARAFVLQDVGYMHWSRSEYGQAQSAYEEVRRIAIEIGDQRAEANALTSLGSLSTVNGDYENSLKYLQEAASIHQRIGNVRVYGLDLNNIGSVYLSLGQYEQAHAYCEKAQQIFQEIQWKPWEAHSLSNLGVIDWTKKDYPKAVETLHQAEEIYRQSNDQVNISTTLRKLSSVYRDAGQYPQALEHLDQALVIARALGSKLKEMQVLSDQGLTYLRLGESEKALACSQSAIDLLRKIRRFPHAQQVLFYHFRVLEAMGQKQAARRFLHRAHRALVRRAQRIQSPEFRESFLKNVLAHQEILTVHERYLARLELSDEECYELLHKARWPDRVTAPCCGSQCVRVHGRVRHSPEKRYLCMPCKKTFSDRTGTVFANKNFSIGELFTALMLVSGAVDEASAVKALTHALKVHARTAANFYRELSAGLREDRLLTQLVQQLQKRTR